MTLIFLNRSEDTICIGVSHQIYDKALITQKSETEYSIWELFSDQS